MKNRSTILFRECSYFLVHLKTLVKRCLRRFCITNGIDPDNNVENQSVVFFHKVININGGDDFSHYLDCLTSEKLPSVNYSLSVYIYAAHLDDFNFLKIHIHMREIELKLIRG